MAQLYQSDYTLSVHGTRTFRTCPERGKQFEAASFQLHYKKAFCRARNTWTTAIEQLD